MTQILELHDISKKVNNEFVFEHLFLSVKENEILVVFHENNKMQTYFIDLLCGLDKDMQGEILLEGKNITKLDSAKRGIQVVYGGEELFPHMTIYENLMFVINQRVKDKKEARELAMNILNKVELYNFKSLLPSKVSMESRFRASVARALATDPKILVFDSPFQKVIKNYMELVATFMINLKKTTNITFLVCSHNTSEGKVISDRIAFIEDKMVKQIGNLAEIYADPYSLNIGSFFGWINSFPGKVVGFEAELAVIQSIDLQTQIRISSSKEFTINDEVSLLVRPEDLALSKVELKDLDSLNSMQGKLIKQTYIGKRFLYNVTLASGRLIQVVLDEKLVLEDKDSSFREGDDVHIYWRFDKMSVIST